MILPPSACARDGVQASAADCRPRIRLDGRAKRAMEVGRTRLAMTGALFALSFLGIGLRLIGVTLLQEAEEPRLSDVPAGDATMSERADILDRNGVVLATSLRTASLYVNPRQVIDPREAAERLAAVLPEFSRAELLARLSADRSFVWLRRSMTPRQQYAVLRLGIPGLDFQTEERRVYPQGALAAHVVGFTDIDNRGLAGIEQSLDAVLRGSSEPLRLALDVRVQHILREELLRAIGEFGAIGGTGIVLDTLTGEMLAMVSLPDFDANLPATAGDEARFNRASLGVYEMGSTFKIFNTAMALDNGIVTLDDGYDASRPLRVAGYTINDYKPKNRWLSVPEIFIYSSNIGSAQMAAEVGTEAQRAFFDELGMLRPAGIELPELGAPKFPGDWRPINTMTIGYGHGMAVTPVHMIAGVAAMLNGGVMRPLTLLARSAGEVPSGERVVSPETSAEMRLLMRMVVEEGTGSKADVPGYLVGGKTGTADKLAGRGYSTNSRIASFVGAFPMTAPRYVILAMVDEPKPSKNSHGYATGGWVAAPVVGRVIQRIAPLLGIEPIHEQAPEPQNDLVVAVSATDQPHAAE